jgi:hypothetical protein
MGTFTSRCTPSGVGPGVGVKVGVVVGVAVAVGVSVTVGVAVGVAVAVGDGVGDGAGDGVGDGVGDDVGDGVAVALGLDVAVGGEGGVSASRVIVGDGVALPIGSATRTADGWMAFNPRQARPLPRMSSRMSAQSQTCWRRFTMCDVPFPSFPPLQGRWQGAFRFPFAIVVRA